MMGSGMGMMSGMGDPMAGMGMMSGMGDPSGMMMGSGMGMGSGPAGCPDGCVSNFIAMGGCEAMSTGDMAKIAPLVPPGCEDEDACVPEAVMACGGTVSDAPPMDNTYYAPPLPAATYYAPPLPAATYYAPPADTYPPAMGSGMGMMSGMGDPSGMMMGSGMGDPSGMMMGSGMGMGSGPTADGSCAGNCGGYGGSCWCDSYC